MKERKRAIEHRIFDARPRSVWEPTDPQLKTQLRDLHEALLSFALAQPQFRELYTKGVVHGFVPKRDIRTHAQTHRDAQSVLQLDLYRAFEFTHRERVLAVLNSLGASPDLVEAINQNAFLYDFLPAGYPSSPTLFNIAMIPVDAELVGLAQERNFTYSRYADDLVFSTSEKHIPQEDIDAAQTIVGRYGYDSHKIRIGHPQSKPVIICGVAIFRGRILVPGKDKRRIRAALRNSLAKQDPPALARATSLLGHVRYIEQTTPRGLQKYRSAIKKLQEQARRIN